MLPHPLKTKIYWSYYEACWAFLHL